MVGDDDGSGAVDVKATAITYGANDCSDGDGENHGDSNEYRDGDDDNAGDVVGEDGGCMCCWMCCCEVDKSANGDSTNDDRADDHSDDE